LSCHFKYLIQRVGVNVEGVMAIGNCISQKPAPSLTAGDGDITFVRQGGMFSTKLHSVTSQRQFPSVIQNYQSVKI
jgi:hypothetical protein